MTQWTAEASAGPARWIGATDQIEVAGRALEGVLAYVGGSVPAVHDTGGDREPAVIDPDVPVAPAGQASVGVWSLDSDAVVSYDALSPEQRAWYLAWLVEPAAADSIPEWAVRLFLAGVERWLYIESRHRPDDRQVVALIPRLADLAGRLAAGPVLDSVVTALVAAVGAAPTGDSALTLPDLRPDWERSRPGATGVFLGWYAAAGQPVPLPSLLAMARAVARDTLPAEAEVCSAEFDELVILRAQGAPRTTPPAGAAGTVQVSVQPSSSSFRLPVGLSLRSVADHAVPALLADVTGPARGVGADLARFARWAGADHPGLDPDTTRRVLLPPELGGHDPSAVPALTELLSARCAGEGVGEVDTAELAAVWPFPVDLATDHGAYHDLLVHVDGTGFRVVPDPRVGDPQCGGRVTVFREDDPTPLDPAALFRLESLRMAWRVMVADGLVTEAQVWRLEDRLEVEAHTADTLTRRLFHTHRWHRVRPDHGFPADAGLAFAPTHDPSTAPLADRHALLRFLVALAVSDGHLAPAETEVLHASAGRLHIDPQAVDALVDRMTRQTLLWPGAEAPIEASEVAPATAAQPTDDTVPAAAEPTDDTVPVPAEPTMEQVPPPPPPVIDLTEVVSAPADTSAWAPKPASILDAVDDAAPLGRHHVPGASAELDVDAAEAARRHGSSLGRRLRGR